MHSEHGEQDIATANAQAPVPIADYNSKIGFKRHKSLKAINPNYETANYVYSSSILPDTAQYKNYSDIPIKQVIAESVSTFSLDMDTARCANSRRFISVSSSRIRMLIG
jgi:Ca-activated chloride channel homolog